MKSNVLSVFLVLALGVFLFACSESEDGHGEGSQDGGGGAPHGGSGGATHETGGTSGTTHSGGTGGTTTDAGSGVHAPIMESVSPLAGALHVTWTNVTADCDQIELLRNKDGGAYDVAYTLTGAATSQHDAEVTSPGTYCYKSVCVKGSVTSPESNEKCGSL